MFVQRLGVGRGRQARQTASQPRTQLAKHVAALLAGSSCQLHDSPVDRRGVIESAEDVQRVRLPDEGLEHVRMAVAVHDSPDAGGLRVQAGRLFRIPGEAQGACEIVQTRRETRAIR
jgi:hypothetical protein